MSLAREKMAWVEDIHGKFEFTDLFAKYTEIVGLTIKEVVLTNMDTETLAIHFTDGRILMIRDGGQSCCESRYMTCDDDLSGHEGGHLISVDLNASAMAVHDPDPPDTERWSSEYHETQFVRVQTTRGSFTLCTHNEHNGYYGGFSLEMTLEA